LPGTQHPAAAYFTRGSGHNAQGNYSERPDDYENNMQRLRRKFENVRAVAPGPVVEKMPDAEIGIIAFGTTHWAWIESRDQLRDEHKLATDYLRIRAFPFSHEIADFVRSHKRVYVVEQNRDAQMFSLLRMDLDAELVLKLRSVARLDGLPIDARSVTDEIAAMEEK
jgi:2-oxoglutarate ferredoxin oxidoreductase subunit alpha